MQTADEALLRFRDAKIVVQQDFDEVAYVRYLLAEEKHTRAGLGLFLCFTADCNLKCSYCFEDYREGLQAKRDLTWSKFESLLRFIDDQKDSWGLRYLDVVFFGGEPLMNYEVVFRAAKALKEYEKNSILVTLSLITNGTLLTTERCRELGPYIDRMQITLDVPKDVHDQRRLYKDGRGTYNDIVANLEAAIKYCKKVFLMPVVDSHSAPFIAELLRHLRDNGAHPDGIINKEGRLDILRSNWYESVAFEPPCVASCIYGPICYGGCKWQAGGPTKRECFKEWLDISIVDGIRTYVVSHYEKKLQNHQIEI